MNWSDLSNFQITCPFPYLKKNYKFVFLDTEIKQREKTKESGYSPSRESGGKINPVVSQLRAIVSPAIFPLP